jgi:hypothetical protein
MSGKIFLNQFHISLFQSYRSSKKDDRFVLNVYLIESAALYLVHRTVITIDHLSLPT